MNTSYVEQFVDTFFRNNLTIHYEDIDYFCDKKLYSYGDIIAILETISTYLPRDRTLHLSARIDCGTSRHIQSWGEHFWALVDYPIHLPIIILSTQKSFLESSHRVALPQRDKSLQYSNTIVYKLDEKAYQRYLYIMKE